MKVCAVTVDKMEAVIRLYLNTWFYGIPKELDMYSDHLYK